MKPAVLLFLLGVLVSSGSLIAACLDSRDLFSALFADRGSERIGLGIQGLQLFHYFAVGIVFSALGVGLLATKRNKTDLLDSISLDSHGSVAFSSGTMKRLEAAMDSMTRSDEESDLGREIVAVKGGSSHDSGGRTPFISQDIDAKSTDSLIDNALRCWRTNDGRSLNVPTGVQMTRLTFFCELVRIWRLRQ